jgi:hypothetical protein
MRIIHRLPFDCSTNEICEIAQLPKIEDRMDTLNLNYFSKCIHSDNELIRDVFEEFKRSRVRPTKYLSIIAKYYDTIKIQNENYTDLFD